MILIKIIHSQYSEDCPGFLDFIIALNVDYNVFISFYETYGCCEQDGPAGVLCEGDRVVSINFSGQNLNGYLDMSLLPPMTVSLFLGDNRLTGSISSIPSTMIVFQVQNNKLNGLLPVLPTGLKYLGVSNNNFTGTLPTLPYFITDVFIGPGNQLGGSVNVSKPFNLNLKDNLIYDLIINDTASLVTCNLDNTPLLGKVDSLTKCSRN